MEQLKQTITETIQLAEATANLFYQQKNQEGLQVLDAVITNIMNTVTDIMNYQKNTNQVVFEDQIFNLILSEALKAIEKKDMVLFADILVYEVNDVLDGCLHKL